MGQFERKIISFEVTVTEIFKQNKHKLSVVQKTEHLICNTIHDRNINQTYKRGCFDIFCNFLRKQSACFQKFSFLEAVTHCNHLWSVLESKCPRIRSFYFYPKAKYGNLYLAPHFDVHIWLQANFEKTNVCRSRIFEIQVFVVDYRQISTRRTFENLRF